MAVDQATNVEQTFDEYVTGVSLLLDEKDSPADDLSLRVGARTWGSRFTYDLLAVKATRSDLSLKHEGKVPPPFNVKTILELDIDLAGMSHMACVARVVTCKEHALFSAKITEIEPDSMQSWEAKVNAA